MSMKELGADTRVGVLGLGYVGLPLAHALGEKYPTVGFDINVARVAAIKAGVDTNLALTSEQLGAPTQTHYSNDAKDLTGCEIFIITAPTPVDSQNQPDLGPVKHATEIAATALQRGGIVIFESTVYPGATEEECVPLLEQRSGLVFNQDFYVGYSPERVNPGDSGHSLTEIIKVTSGSTPAAADKVDALYRSIIKAGTHRASSIRVAEAAKVIENTQRDLNIALVNELAILFGKLGIDTKEVLDAAGSKWNFLPFKPGLVGGHCIGVDPYYLTYKAQQVGYHPDVILAGRRINDSMGAYVAGQLVRLMLSKRVHVTDARVLVMGLAFKENCPDTRNSRVVDIITELQSYHVDVDVYDPWVDRSASSLLIEAPAANTYDAIMIAVAHQQFVALGIEGIRAFGKSKVVIYDVKHLFAADQVDGSL
jgi:UDP-N-acetyl-D-galactosamine dehydrogenase